MALDESEAMAPIRAMLATSLISSVLVLVVAVALLGVVLTRRLRQLTLVRDAMHEIGAGDGDLSRRIDAHGEDELAQIAGSFNSFAVKLSGGGLRRSGTPAVRCLWPPRRSPPAITT